MTTQELKNKIDKILGNSIRCLLHSFSSGGDHVLYVPVDGETLPSDVLLNNKYLRDNFMLDEVNQIKLMNSDGSTMIGI